MEKEEQIVVPEEQKQQVELEEEDDETSPPLLRKSTVNGSNTITIEANGTCVGVHESSASNGRDGDEKISNGHPEIQSLSVVAANGEAEDNGVLDEKIKELNGGVLQDEPQLLNRSGNLLVFYDRDEGIWKCRICTWTYGNGSVCVPHFRHHSGQFHKRMSVKTLKFESGENQVHEDLAPDELDSSNGSILQDNSTETKYEGHFENGTSFSPNIPLSKTLFEGPNTSNRSSKEIESAEVDLINEDELEEVNLDVENVLKKQTTHDLYCPNCNSCITKRVILRKRKRGARTSVEEAKRNKVEGATSGDGVEVVGFDDTKTRTDENEPEREPDVFRCLSCFSFFIPCSDGFRLFGKYGGKSGKENVEGEQVVVPPNVKKNWFGFMFASSTKQEMQVVQDARAAQDEAYTSRPSKESKANKQVQVNQESPKMTQLTNGESADPSQGGSMLLISSSEGTSTHEYLDQREISNLTLKLGASEDEEHQLLPTPVPALAEFDTGGKLSISVADPHEEQQVGAYILTKSVVENNNATFASSGAAGQVYPSEFSQHTITKATYEVHTGETFKVDNMSSVMGLSVTQGKDTVITIETQPAESSQIPQGVITTPTALASPLLLSGTQIAATGDGERSEQRKEIEVIKSIVYGGLAESITSLSVVSSAAGGGAATLNILALGMANLIGGIFIICHNLWELRNDRIEQVANQISDEVTDRRDRYKEVLGRRQNFILHAVVAIISYLMFGSVAPVVYGFSFRESDDKEFKLLAVGAASLLCILVLAVGKAYVQIRPYIKTVFTFVALGFMVSGVSYAGGVLFERLLEKLRLFEPPPTPVSNLFLPAQMTAGVGGRGAQSAAAWSSY